MRAAGARDRSWRGMDFAVSAFCLAENDMPTHSSDMQACIEECLRCYQSCLGMAMNHCLEAGGRHVEPGHFKLMMACAEICRTSAHFMLINTPHHKHTCAECAEICEECARNCDGLDGMEECVKRCRACAESCRRMAA